MAFNELTDSEAERLAILAEECAEVIYVVGKILRHGYESFNPVTNTGKNRSMLEKEIGDLGTIINMMVQAKDVDDERIDYYHEEKAKTISKYLHYN